MEFVLIMTVLVIVGLVAALIAISRRSGRGRGGPESPDAAQSRAMAHGIRNSQNQAGGM